MKKSILTFILIIALVVPAFSGCSCRHEVVIDPAVFATSFETGLTEGSHCARCGEVLVAQEVVPLADSVQMDFAGGYVTTEPTVIETEHMRLNIPANVYILDDLVEYINIITSAIEEVSGLKFDTCSEYYKKIEVTVVKNTNTQSETEVHAYANYGAITIASGDLLDMYALIHETSHILKYYNSPWSYCTWAEEAISTYNTYKVQKYLAANHPELVPFAQSANKSLRNMEVNQYEPLYAQPLEYWMDHVFEYAANNNYVIGFALSWYLDEVYGDYTKWITAYEKANPYSGSSNYQSLQNGEMVALSNAEQLRAFELAYGADALSNFYDWLKNNEDICEYEAVDLRGADKIQLFPSYVSFGITFYLDTGDFVTDVCYKDLVIGFDAAKQYMEYKGTDTAGLLLEIIVNDKDGALVESYDSEGRLLHVYSVTVEADSEWTTFIEIPLDGVSFVRFVGESKMHRVVVGGFDDTYGN